MELVNCKRMKIQIRETAPTVNIDKTDGCLVYLSEASLATTFTTAKSSEVSLLTSHHTTIPRRPLLSPPTSARFVCNFFSLPIALCSALLLSLLDTHTPTHTRTLAHTYFRTRAPDERVFPHPWHR